MASTIQKIRSRCAINVRTIIHTYVAINVHRANILIYFHSSHLVQIHLPFVCDGFKVTINFIISTEILPLVEFSPEDDIPEAEVERLLMAPPKISSTSYDPFVDTMINEEVSDMLPLTLDRDALRNIDPTTILIAKWPRPLKTRYYRNLMPEWQISMCPECLQVNLLYFRRGRYNLLIEMAIFFTFTGIPHGRL